MDVAKHGMSENRCGGEGRSWLLIQLHVHLPVMTTSFLHLQSNWEEQGHCIPLVFGKETWPCHLKDCNLREGHGISVSDAWHHRIEVSVVVFGKSGQFVKGERCR